MTKENKSVIDALTSETTNGEIQPLSSHVQDEIGRRLRTVYGTLASEPLPDKFLKLLDQLSKSSDDVEADTESKK